MKIDLTVILKDHRGKDIPNANGLTKEEIEALVAAGEQPPAYTLGEALLVAAIETPDAGNDAPTKLKRWRLGQRLLDVDSVDLTAEDIAFCKTLVAKAWASPIMVGIISDLVDPPGKDGKARPKKTPPVETE